MAKDDLVSVFEDIKKAIENGEVDDFLLDTKEALSVKLKEARGKKK